MEHRVEGAEWQATESEQWSEQSELQRPMGWPRRSSSFFKRNRLETYYMFLNLYKQNNSKSGGPKSNLKHKNSHGPSINPKTWAGLQTSTPSLKRRLAPWGRTSAHCSKIMLLISLTCTCSIAQLCPTFCNRMDCSPPGPSVLGIFSARVRLQRLLCRHSKEKQRDFPGGLVVKNPMQETRVGSLVRELRSHMPQGS